MNSKANVGRRKKFNPLGEKFLRLYLDPLQKNEQICRHMRISSATFFRYVEELSLPTLKVGIGNFTEQPHLRALVKPSFRLQRYDLEVVRSLGYLLGVRFKLFPVDNFLSRLKTGDVDMVVSRISWTKSRARDFHCSLPYEFHEFPHGVLFRNSTVRGERRLKRNEKPILAVMRDSIHSEFAYANLQHQFKVQEYTTISTTLRALSSLQADRALLHTSISEMSATVEIDSKPFKYDSFTTIVLAKSAEWLLKPLNQALEVMHDHQHFTAIKRATEAVNYKPTSDLKKIL